MPIWDSVQRGLEKASQEAARLARTQRLRSTMDNTARQMNTLNSNIVNKTMDLFISGQITHPELLSLCQELEHLRQQFEQMQGEMQQIQAAQSQTQGQLPPGASPYPPAISSNPALYPSTITDVGATQLAPPPPEYSSYMGSTEEDLTPPPPPDVVNAASNVYPVAQPTVGVLRCPACGYEVQPHHAFCQSCGTRIQSNQQGNQDTVRGSSTDPGTGSGGNEATIRAPEPQIQPAPDAPDQNQGA